ncbi:hypothetical protein VYU27_007668 [Nannochloropsis oceanica]
MLSRVFTSAMRPAVQQTRANATRMATSIRHKGTAPLQSHYGGKPKGFKETWLMDGATYPIIVIITFAVTMCSSFTAYKFFNSPDNRVDPRKRSTLLRDWTK